MNMILNTLEKQKSKYVFFSQNDPSKRTRQNLSLEVNALTLFLFSLLLGNKLRNNITIPESGISI